MKSGGDMHTLKSDKENMLLSIYTFSVELWLRRVTFFIYIHKRLKISRIMWTVDLL